MITIELAREEREYAEKMIEVSELSTGIIEVKSFDGWLNDAIQVGIALSPTVVPALALIISEMIKKNKRVNIKVGKVEIEGLSEDNALHILDKLLQQEGEEHND